MYGELLGEFELTYYSACEECCDVEKGLTSTGTQVIKGQTIAAEQVRKTRLIFMSMIMKKLWNSEETKQKYF